MSADDANAFDAIGADAFEPGASVPNRDRSAADHLARGLSLVINPLVLPPLLFGLVLAHRGAPLAEIGWATGVGLVFFALVPLAYVLRQIRRQRILSLDIPRRARRSGPLLVSVGAYGVALVVLYATTTTAAPLLAAVAGVHALNTLAVLFVTLRWKISIHTLALGGFISILLFVAQTPRPELPAEEALLHPGPVSALGVLLALLPLLALLVWARVRLRAHTPGQALAGAAVGLALPYAELMLLTRSGWL